MERWNAGTAYIASRARAYEETHVPVFQRSNHGIHKGNEWVGWNMAVERAVFQRSSDKKGGR
ncbi:hypothetical protein NA8A_04783 [Nitratireductor indicus C115]|uniref:Uncharacterized protein n=1 Tax=Nitratireductor indicus C115 TaxID=1231190 RepID=K2N761_9HYPH|nr:hypothetical protein [Nitratireductor indicus]EKF43318.1 hypothetical protein NA8A_04783 [Nitratireductor indicus C115]SFQ10155.1 hypothetical protein SAMN05216176_101348 [Nitratireductor indicus]